MARIVIVGLGAGGFAAILAARRTDRAVEITVIDDKPYDLMHPCGLPYAVEGVIEDFEKLRHDLHLDRMRVDVLRPFRAERIDTTAGTVDARSDTGETRTVSYDTLILATGARPFIPPVPGLETLIGKSAFTVASPEDAEALHGAAKPGMRAVCLGAGAIGLETAVALRRLGLDVTVVEMLSHVFPRALDPDIADLVREHLESLGIRVLCGVKLEAVTGDDRLESVRVGAEDMPADLLVIAAGVRANAEIAAAAGIDAAGGIPVNDRMETSTPGVYAIGDCARTQSIIDGRPFTMQLSTTAYRQGTVAGVNAAGGNAVYPGVSGAFVSKVGDIEVAAVGYTSAFAEAAGYKPLFGKIKDGTLFDWFPGSEPITVKVIADEATSRVIGAQAVAPSGAAWRVNVASAAIHSGMTLDRMAEIELAYCPPVSQTYDPLMKAADFAIRKRR